MNTIDKACQVKTWVRQLLAGYDIVGVNIITIDNSPVVRVVTNKDPDFDIPKCIDDIPVITKVLSSGSTN